MLTLFSQKNISFIILLYIIVVSLLVNTDISAIYNGKTESRKLKRMLHTHYLYENMIRSKKHILLNDC